MRMLIVDSLLKEQIKELIEFAEENPLTMDDLLDIKNGAEPAPGDRKGYSFGTSTGFKIVYTIEKQVPGDCRHLSVSVDKDNAFPNPEAVQELMSLFGFKGKFKDCNVFLEKYAENRGAVNIVQLK